MATRIKTLLVCVLIILVSVVRLNAAPVANVPVQPLRAQIKRVVEALSYVGTPLTIKEQAALSEITSGSDEEFASAIQALFETRTLAEIHINPESRVKVSPGSAKPLLVQNGWTIFLIRVHNEAGITAPLRLNSPQNGPVYIRSRGQHAPDENRITTTDIKDRWLALQSFDKQPLTDKLSGLLLEYRVIGIYSRDKGQREAVLTFDAGQGTQDLGFRSSIPILFTISTAVEVQLLVRDDDGSPTVAEFVITDAKGRVYPSRLRRLEPDFYFHDQIYRYDGESISLPPGDYTFRVTRGPEYLVETRMVTIPPLEKHTLTFDLGRWIKLADRGWVSGDHHIHAAGCAHYDSPTQGVNPATMMRHILGEDLQVGCVLTWGPCWYYQKDFFEGRNHALSTRNNVMRYDIEVSGFPSSHAGHLCLLRLTEDDYPNTTTIEEWPSWDLPVLKWGKEQGGVVGFSHSGWGLAVDEEVLPSYQMPKFDGIGANEFVVDVTHDVVDFISAVDTPIIWELSVWYHTLNCGFDTRISGETDFPCIYGERVGLGRSYVKLPPKKKVKFDDWVQGIKDGRSYVGDGKSHLFDFKVNELGVGEKGRNGRASYLSLPSTQPIVATVSAAALLAESPLDDLQTRPLRSKPYWHVERARIGSSRQVPVELIVNGVAVETQTIDADGGVSDIIFDYQLTKSSWIAVRILATAHTNPIFVEVDDKPIRASKRSAQWCLEAVDVCWQSKMGRMRMGDQADAKLAYDHARQRYKAIIAESFDDSKDTN
ncbi:MAG: CehA/McbA family metallohydrolase [Planctomycetaceae bacterium]|nr:CehA/McbA family metallohydrolase [Planctomycetaceae bacterium]